MSRLGAALATLVSAGALAAAANAATPAQFAATLKQIGAQPYQPNYVPQGYDSAFGSQNVLNVAPAQDYTSGSIPGSPDAPAWPATFKPVLITAPNDAPLLGQLALRPGKHPGIVVVHGFNTHGYASVIRWAAMLAKNGYNVLAADQRDFSFEYSAGYGYPKWLQTFGWKESEDVLRAGRFLASQPGVTSVGIVGFSEGAQNTVLALALDARSTRPVFSAGLTFSPPADQNTQIYSTAAVPGCRTPLCTYPTTNALVQLVVPPYTYTDVCDALGDAAAYYHTTGFDILARENAFHRQTQVRVPLANFYSADDSLVPAFQARMMAGYEAGNALQRTLMVQRGEHAYFYDRWWQQRAILLYFKSLLPGAAADPAVGTAATVSQTPGGAAFSSQLVDLSSATWYEADALLAPYICDTSKGRPGAGF